jgi:hypothetical protein
MGVPSLNPAAVRAAVEKASKGPASARAAPKQASKEHGSQLREAAREWANSFSSLLEPDWAVHKTNLSVADSDERLIALRAHFPKLNSGYSKWRAMNISLRGVETLPYWIAGGLGQMPTTGEGKRALKEHNDLLRAIVAELGEIEVQTSIAGQCDQCQ